MRYVALLFIAFLFVSCSIKPDVDSTTQIDRYRLLTPKISKTKKPPLQKTLKIALPVAPKFLYTDKIAYMQKDGSFGFYQFSKWDESVAKQLQFLFANSIRQSGLYENVIVSPSLIKNDLLLESRIDTFVYLYDKQSSQIQIDINLYLIDSTTKKAAKSKYLSIRENVEANSPQKIMLGFHRATRVLNQKIIIWLNK